MPTLRDETFDLDASNNDAGVTVEEPRQSVTSEPARKSRKVQVPLTTDGRIDMELLNSSQRPKIEKALALEVEARLKAVPVSKKEIVQFNRDFVPNLYDALAFLMRTGAGLTKKFPPDFLQYLHYTPEQKQKLAEPTARFIEYLSPSWLVHNQELSNFILAFSTITGEMFTNAAKAYMLSKGLTDEQIEILKQQAGQQVNGHIQPDVVVAN